MTKRPFFLAGIVYLMGTAVAFLSQQPHLWLLFALCAGIIFLLKRPKHRILSLFLCGICLLSFVSAAAWQKQKEELLSYIGKPLRIEGLITESRHLVNSAYYEAEVNFGKKRVPVSFFSMDMELLPAGERFRAIVSLEENDESFAAAVLLSGEAEQLESLGEDDGIKACCLRLRTGIQQRIDHLFTGKSREVLSGILLGEKAELSEQVEEVFEKSGTLHLLTVSGFHISMMSAGIFALLKFLRQSPRRAAFFMLPVLLLLAMVQGMTVSVLRAAIMSAINYLALIMQRDYDGLSAWGLAVVVVLVTNPIMLFSKSFLLSYFAVLGILLCYRTICDSIFSVIVLPKAHTVRNKIVHRIGSVMAMTLSANLLTAAFLLYFFGYVPLASLLSSPFAFSILPCIMAFAAAAIAMPWELAAQILAKITTLLCALLYGFLQHIAKLDWNIYADSALLLTMILLFYALLLLLFIGKVKRRKALPILYSYLCACVLLWNISAFYAVPQLEIIICRRALTLAYEGRVAVVGLMETENDREEIEKILRSHQVEQLDFLYLTGEARDDGAQALRFVEKWKPRFITAAVETAAFDLLGINYQIGLQTLHLWNGWSLCVQEDSAILADGGRKVLKLQEKYAIIKDMSEKCMVVCDDEGLVWAEENLTMSQTWDDRWKITVKQEV